MCFFTLETRSEMSFCLFLVREDASHRAALGHTQEAEALEAIFMEDFKVDDSDASLYTISLAPETDEAHVSAVLTVRCPADYPSATTNNPARVRQIHRCYPPPHLRRAHARVARTLESSVASRASRG